MKTSHPVLGVPVTNVHCLHVVAWSGREEDNSPWGEYDKAGTAQVERVTREGKLSSGGVGKRGRGDAGPGS